MGQPGGGEVAGTDYDQLKVSNGSVTGLGNVDLVVDFERWLKSPSFKGDVLTILTCNNNLSGQEFNSVTLTEDWRAVVNYNAGSVTLTDIYKKARGTVVVRNPPIFITV